VIGEEIRGIAELLAFKPERQILGEAEFQVPDRVTCPRRCYQLLW
jgi:hypothetical protein